MAQTKIVGWLICGLAISLLTLMLPGTVLAHGEGGGTVIIGGYQVSLVFTEPVKAGQNLFHVQILDGMGMPVRGAQVIISAKPAESAQPHQGSMAGMAGMAGMEGMASTEGSAQEMGGMGGMHGMSHGPAAVPVRVTANETDAEYSGVIAFSAAGHWMANTHAIVNGQMLMADFPVDVEHASSAHAFAILVAFIALNAFIIWLASFTKRKSVLPEPTVELT
ncbi:MAG: hypothetical protein NTX45_29555 [Proteobacteria bacterium]|nr:hypothetical protein [Pseudomonadota bacterium]